MIFPSNQESFKELQDMTQWPLVLVSVVANNFNESSNQQGSDRRCD